MTKERKLRDLLAVERTDLAIDRTLLAYLRTSLTVVVVGVSFIKLFYTPILGIIGWLLIIIASVLFIFGVVRCANLKNKNGD
jgi:putative membrane protein